MALFCLHIYIFTILDLFFWSLCNVFFVSYNSICFTFCLFDESIAIPALISTFVEYLDSVVKNPPANARITEAAGLIPESGRSPGRGNGSPLQYSCQDNLMDRGAWQATVHGVAKSQTQLSTHYLTTFFHMLSICICL